MTIKTRKPTGVVPWPLVLIEGPEKSGKSWACAQFSASDKVGQAYWLDFGEGTADEYGAIKGASYLLVDHDGTWRDIIEQVEEVRAEAERAAKAKEPPVVLVVDSMTVEWSALSDWAAQRAKRQAGNRKKLAADPDADITISMNLWNDATSRHRRLMTLLLTFPGIVVMTARGKEVAAIGDDGKPSGDKTYKVEGHKTLAYDASVWVRMSRDSAPIVVGARSVHHGVRPGVDAPVPAPQFTLDWLVFEILGCDPGVAEARDVKAVEGGDPTPDELGVSPLAQVKEKTWAEAKRLGLADEGGQQLADDYAAWSQGSKLADATVDELRTYLEYLRTQQPSAGES
jgi:AAA domain